MYDTYELHSGETMTRWVQRVMHKRMAHPQTGEAYTISGLDWVPGEGGLHKKVQTRKDDGSIRHFTYWEAKQLVEI